MVNILCERFLRLVPLGSSESASALHEAIVKVFSDRGLNINNIFVNAFDGGTNKMSGSIGGLQRYICFESPFSKYINCKSHHFALAFVHLTQKHEVLGELDSLLLQLWIKFKLSTTNKSVLEEIQLVNPKTLKILKASATRWLSHGNSTIRVIEIFEKIVDSLDATYEKWKDPEITGVRDALLCHSMILFNLFLADLLQISNNFCKFLQNWAMHFSLLPSRVERLKECLENTWKK